MKIAFLSWGSLIETGVQRGLRITGGWNQCGPLLPIEFSRISQSGARQKCLTLVIDETNGCDVPTHYAVCSHPNLNVALMNLRVTENITLVYSIGYVNLISGTERGWARQNTPLSCDRIKEWARAKQFDAVVWTSLLPNFEKVLETPFTVEDAVAYVKSLPEPYQTAARSYILKAPMQVITPVRSILMRDWMEENTAAQAVLDEALQHEESPRGEDTLMRFLNRFRCHR
jgi:hypothetical protein